MEKHATDIVVAWITFAASTTIAIIFTLLKSLINLFCCCKLIPSLHSESDVKPVLTCYPFQKLSSSRYSPESTIYPLCQQRDLVRFTANPPPDWYDFVVYPVITGKTRACYVLKRAGLDETRQCTIPNPEISIDERRRKKTSSLSKHVAHTVGASVIFTASLAIAFFIYAVITATEITICMIKSLINLLTCCKSIPSPPSKPCTISPYLPKPVVTCNLSQTEQKFSSSEKILIPESSKRTLFLGLNRVLVRVTLNPPRDRFDFVVYPLIKGKRRACYVLKRPGLDELLRAAKNASFDIIIYAGDLSGYAAPIIDMLDPTREFITHLSSTTCRQLDRSVIIDVSPKKHIKQRANTVIVRPFFGQHTDTDLINLVKFFEVERSSNDLWQLIHLKKLGIASLTAKDSEEFNIPACRISVLQSLDFQSLPPPFVQSPKLIGPLEKLPFWIHFHNNLVELSLKDSKLPENAIQFLHRLPHLTALSLLDKSYNAKDLKSLGFLKPEFTHHSCM